MTEIYLEEKGAAYERLPTARKTRQRCQTTFRRTVAGRRPLSGSTVVEFQPECNVKEAVVFDALVDDADVEVDVIQFAGNLFELANDVVCESDTSRPVQRQGTLAD
jgi:hypothetical protein